VFLSRKRGINGVEKIGNHLSHQRKKSTSEAYRIIGSRNQAS
jgi:hypothetical protein